MTIALLLGAGGVRTFGSLIGFLVAILIGYACSRIAAGKGRSQGVWFVLGFLFTILALIVIALLPSKHRARL